MKSWTRTLNLDDAHSLLAIARNGRAQGDWAKACHPLIPELSLPRRRELIRLVRDNYLDWNKDMTVRDGLFHQFYWDAPASAQVELVDVQWATSHPLTLIAVETLVKPALEKGATAIRLAAVESLVAKYLETESAESKRKTRTVLLGAMEGIGTLRTRGTGQHRSLEASRGAPHPIVFAYLVHKELRERGIDAMMTSEVLESLPVRLTQCTRAHAQACLDANLASGILVSRGDEIALN